MNKSFSTDPPRLRPAIIGDAEGIARVQIDSWHTTYRGIVPDDFLASMSCGQNAERWSQRLQDAAERNLLRVTLVAEAPASDGGGIIGFVSGGPEREGKDGFDGELYALYLLQEYQRKGVGAALVREFMREMGRLGFRSILVWVLSDNPSRRFYERAGGIEVRRKMIEIGGAELEETGYGWELQHAL